MKFAILCSKIDERGIKKTVIAKRLGISERTFQRKMNGGAPFSWEQACAIQEHFFPDMDLKSLFAKDNNSCAS